jgi:NDP-sugar pyrophosphorylase family protein
VTLGRNVPCVVVNNTLVGGNFTIKDASIFHYLDLYDSESNPLYSVILTNVRVEKNVIIGPNNKFMNSILIENSIIIGDLIIDGNNVTDGSITIRNTFVGGRIRIEKVSVTKPIFVSATTNNSISICPEPFSRTHRGSTLMDVTSIRMLLQILMGQ